MLSQCGVVCVHTQCMHDQHAHSHANAAAEIVFTSQPQDAIVLTDQSVCFGCDYTGTSNLPIWNITGTVYFTTSLPLVYKYIESSRLCIDHVTLSMNNSYYACYLYGGPKSSTGHLTIIETTGVAFFIFNFLPYFTVIKTKSH